MFIFCDLLFLREPGQQVVRATQDAKPKRTRSEILRAYWRDVKSGKRVRKETPAELPKDPNCNPLLKLADMERSQLYVLLRECPHAATANEVLRQRGIAAITTPQLQEFLDEEAYHYWEIRSACAAREAGALVHVAEKSLPVLSTGILAALGQEAFKQVSSGNADPAAMSRIVSLFFKARGDGRTDEMHELKCRKLLGELEGRLGQAFANLAEEVKHHPAAQEAFDALQRELAENGEDVA